MLQTNPDLHFQLLDEDGNSINLTTADGKSIPIVSSGDKKFEGLLPDGTLVSFDIICHEQEEEQANVEGSEVIEVYIILFLTLLRRNVTTVLGCYCLRGKLTRH